MSVIITEGIVDYINVDRFRILARNNGVPVSGSKKDLVLRITEAVNGEINNSTLSEEKLDAFIAEEINFGKNRMLFISSFPSSQLQNVSTLEKVTEFLEKKGFPQGNFNILKSTYKPEYTTLVYLNVISENDLNNTDKISMCFAKTLVLDNLLDEEGEPLPPKKVTDYIWVDILPIEEKIIIKLRQRYSNTWTNNSKAKEIYDEIATIVRETFSLAPTSMGEFKNVFYKIYKELTKTAEKPFRDKVSPFMEEITTVANGLSEKVGIESSSSPVNLPYRLSKLLERALIQQDFDLYERYFAGKKGIVNRIYYSDETGASVNARSSDREEGIAVADIYFDTKESIEENGKLDKLWVKWFYKFDDETPLIRIETKFEAYKEYFMVHFLYAYTTKEVQEHVLSNLKYFEGLSD